MSLGFAEVVSARTSSGWVKARYALPLMAVALVSVGWDDVVDAVSIWWSSTAYTYCFLVLPLAVVVAAQPGRWERIRASSPCPDARVLAVMPAVAVAWFVADRLGIREGRQLMLVAAFVVGAVAVIGLPAARAAAAPLLYLFLLVPVGEFLVPALQRVTVGFITFGLDLSGLLYFNDGLSIEIPEGRFYVAEACAGLRFLIACVAFGITYALVFFRSPGRRVVFILASLVVPVVANGLRAFGIVYLGHLMGSAEAAVVDHLLYGYVFFSCVVLFLAAAGYPFVQRPLMNEALPPAVSSARPRAFAAVSVGALLLFVAAPAVATAMDLFDPVVVSGLDLDLGPVAGCDAAGSPRGGVATFSCAGVGLSLEASALPGGVGPSAVTRLRRTVSTSDGPVVAEVVDGPWTVVARQSPAVPYAYSFWVDGLPSSGGLRERLALARDSIFGARCAVVALVVRPVGPDASAGVSAMGSFMTAVGAGGRLASVVRRAACRD